MVLSVVEVRAVLQQLEGPPGLVSGLLYGAGLRLMEARATDAMRLRLERDSHLLLTWAGVHNAR